MVWRFLDRAITGVGSAIDTAATSGVVITLDVEGGALAAADAGDGKFKLHAADVDGTWSAAVDVDRMGSTGEVMIGVKAASGVCDAPAPGVTGLNFGTKDVDGIGSPETIGVETAAAGVCGAGGLCSKTWVDTTG